MTPRVLHLAKDLALPLDTVTEKLCWLGRTGSGKTYGAMKLAELMLEAGAQVGALDPVGVWRALRVPGEKGGTSFEVVVFGGLYGDLPLEPHAGELIADLVCDRGLSFVLDVSQFIPSEQQRFARAFADRFFHRKKSAPSAVHLFLEECQEFIPENPSGEEAKTLGVFQRLWKLGRNFGIGGSLISQRPQEISKKALNMSGTMFAFQMTGPQERKTVRTWVADHGIATDIESVLQRLQTGSPHVESPTFLEVSKTVRILPRVTADLSSTPKVGASTAARRPLTPIDVEQLRVSMATTIEKAKADDPRELRRQIADLQQQVAQAAKQPNQKIEPKRQPKRVEVLTDADRALLEKVAGRLGDVATLARSELLNELDEVKRVVLEAGTQCCADVIATRSGLIETLERQLDAKGFQKILGKLSAVPAAEDSLRVQMQPRQVAVVRPVVTLVRATPRTPAVVTSDRDPSIGRSGLHRMLVALAQRPQGLTRGQLGVRAKVSSKGGSFDTYLSKARVNGWIDSTGDRIVITSAGVAALGAYEPLPKGRALLEHYVSQFGSSGAARMLTALAEAFPSALSRAELSDRSGVSAAGGSFDTYLSKLRTLELIEGKSELRASGEFFG